MFRCWKLGNRYKKRKHLKLIKITRVGSHYTHDGGYREVEKKPTEHQLAVEKKPTEHQLATPKSSKQNPETDTKTSLETKPTIDEGEKTKETELGIIIEDEGDIDKHTDRTIIDNESPNVPHSSESKTRPLDNPVPENQEDESFTREVLADLLDSLSIDSPFTDIRIPETNLCEGRPTCPMNDCPPKSRIFSCPTIDARDSCPATAIEDSVSLPIESPKESKESVPLPTIELDWTDLTGSRHQGKESSHRSKRSEVYLRSTSLGVSSPHLNSQLPSRCPADNLPVPLRSVSRDSPLPARHESPYRTVNYTDNPEAQSDGSEQVTPSVYMANVQLLPSRSPYMVLNSLQTPPNRNRGHVEEGGNSSSCRAKGDNHPSSSKNNKCILDRSNMNAEKHARNYNLSEFSENGESLKSGELLCEKRHHHSNRPKDEKNHDLLPKSLNMRPRNYTSDYDCADDMGGSVRVGDDSPLPLPPSSHDLLNDNHGAFPNIFNMRPRNYSSDYDYPNDMGGSVRVGSDSPLPLPPSGHAQRGIRDPLIDNRGAFPKSLNTRPRNYSSDYDYPKEMGGTVRVGSPLPLPPSGNAQRRIYDPLNDNHGAFPKIFNMRPRNYSSDYDYPDDMGGSVRAGGDNPLPLPAPRHGHLDEDTDHFLPALPRRLDTPYSLPNNNLEPADSLKVSHSREGNSNDLSLVVPIMRFNNASDDAYDGYDHLNQLPRRNSRPNTDYDHINNVQTDNSNYVQRRTGSGFPSRTISVSNAESRWNSGNGISAVENGTATFPRMKTQRKQLGSMSICRYVRSDYEEIAGGFDRTEYRTDSRDERKGMVPIDLDTVAPTSKFTNVDQHTYARVQKTKSKTSPKSNQAVVDSRTPLKSNPTKQRGAVNSSSRSLDLEGPFESDVPKFKFPTRHVYEDINLAARNSSRGALTSNHALSNVGGNGLPKLRNDYESIDNEESPNPLLSQRLPKLRNDYESIDNDMASSPLSTNRFHSNRNDHLSFAPKSSTNEYESNANDQEFNLLTSDQPVRELNSFTLPISRSQSHYETINDTRLDTTDRRGTIQNDDSAVCFNRRNSNIFLLQRSNSEISLPNKEESSFLPSPAGKSDTSKVETPLPDCHSSSSERERSEDGAKPKRGQSSNAPIYVSESKRVQSSNAPIYVSESKRYDNPTRSIHVSSHDPGQSSSSRSEQRRRFGRIPSPGCPVVKFKKMWDLRDKEKSK